MAEDVLCLGCQANIGVSLGGVEPDADNSWCNPCERRLPSDVRKAVCDPFDYELGTTWGWVIRFSAADIEGEWLRLRPLDERGIRITRSTGSIGEDAEDDQLSFVRFPRGLTLRLADIQWIADAPEGS